MNVCMFLVSSSGKAGLNGDSKHDLCYAGEVLCQSSYKANFMWAKDGKHIRFNPQFLYMKFKHFIL